MKACITVGKVKETEKAIKVSFWSATNYRGFKAGERWCTLTAWLPKSQIEIIEQVDKPTSYTTYTTKTATTHRVNECVKLEVPRWLYEKSLTYCFGV